MKVEYLGDAVYVQIDDHGEMLLTTEHHDPWLAGNRIYIGPDVYMNLEKFVKNYRKESSSGTA